MPYNMLFNPMFSKQMRDHLKHMAAEKTMQMPETHIYVGLNDADTKQQIYETDHYKTVLKKVCYDYHVPFSVAIEDGGYFHEDGEYTEEKSLVLTLLDAKKETIKSIAETLCDLFHQESVMVTEGTVTGFFVKGKKDTGSSEGGQD